MSIQSCLARLLSRNFYYALLLGCGLEAGFASSALGEIYFNNFTSQATVTVNPACLSPTGETIDKLTDNVIKTSKWLVKNSTTAVPFATFTFTTPQHLDAYTLFTGNDVANLRQPTAWTVFGSNDNGATWSIVDQRSGVAQTGVNTPLLFYVNSGAAETTNYSQYKLSIDSWTDSSQDLMQISEFQMFSLEQGKRIGLDNASATVTNNSGTVAPANSETEAIRFANDSQLATKFCTPTEPSADNPVIVTYTFNSAQEVVAYSLTSANDYPGRTPSQWTLAGSNDSGTTWTDLSSVNTLVGTTFFPIGTALDSAQPYSQYKLTITQTGKSLGFVDDKGIQFSEFALYGADTIASTPLDLTKIANTKFTYTPSAASTWGDGNASNAFDHNASTKWGLNDPTPGMEFSLGTEFAVNSYTITAVNETGSLGRNPKSWTLSGKAEDDSWVVLDTRENIDFYSGTDYTTLKTQTFSFDNQTKYQDYKLEITANNGDATKFQLADFELYSTYESLAPTGKTLLELSKHPAVRVSATASSYGDTPYIESDTTIRKTANLGCAFDGSKLTKLCVTGFNLGEDNPYEITFNYQDDLEFVLTEYTITTANDIDGRDPAKWAIYGSQNGSTWYCLDEVALTADTIYGVERNADQIFLLNNDNAYNYYRFSFMETRNAGLEVFQLSELTLRGYAGVNYEVPEPSACALLLLGIGGLFWLRRKPVGKE